MDGTQRFRGTSNTTRYRTKIEVMCPTHSAGHSVKMYSRGTDDAWMLAEVLALHMASRGYACMVQFQQSSDGKVWEIVSPHEPLPDEPVF